MRIAIAVGPYAALVLIGSQAASLKLLSKGKAGFAVLHWQIQLDFSSGDIDEVGSFVLLCMFQIGSWCEVFAKRSRTAVMQLAERFGVVDGTR